MVSHAGSQPAVGNGENSGRNLQGDSRIPTCPFCRRRFWKAGILIFWALSSAWTALSTLPRQTTKTTIFSLSLRLNLRVLLRGSSAEASIDSHGSGAGTNLAQHGPCYAQQLPLARNGPFALESFQLTQPARSVAKPREGVSPGRTYRVQCHPYARRRRSTYRQPGDHGLASGAAARAHRRAVGRRAQDDHPHPVELSLRGQ